MLGSDSIPLGFMQQVVFELLSTERWIMLHKISLRKKKLSAKWLKHYEHFECHVFIEHTWFSSSAHNPNSIQSLSEALICSFTKSYLWFSTLVPYES